MTPTFRYHQTVVQVFALASSSQELEAARDPFLRRGEELDEPSRNPRDNALQLRAERSSPSASATQSWASETASWHAVCEPLVGVRGFPEHNAPPSRPL